MEVGAGCDEVRQVPGLCFLHEDVAVSMEARTTTCLDLQISSATSLLLHGSKTSVGSYFLPRLREVVFEVCLHFCFRFRFDLFGWAAAPQQPGFAPNIEHQQIHSFLQILPHHSLRLNLPAITEVYQVAI